VLYLTVLSYCNLEQVWAKSIIKGAQLVINQTLPSNNRAFTLVEVLVAMLILMVGLLGMLQVINLAIRTNLQNEMRDQAVAIAEDRMAREKSLPFDNITASSERSINIASNIRNGIANYTVTLRVDNIGNSKKIDIGVRWQHRGLNYEHIVSSLATKAAAQ
jgi:type IV pilus assembly protein PilV